MSWVKQRYRDVSPVMLQVVGGAASSSLYCGEVEGLLGAAAGLVESFLVELYRCKLCQFTCGLKASISSHLLLRHRPPALTCLEGGAEGGEEAGLQRGASPYQLDLNGEAKQSDEDEDFLLYNMLDNMSPPTCDISTEGGLQVAHTCEVSTLFEEEDLSCPMDPPSTQEQMAQSAHLMTLGLCRISKPAPPPSTSSPVQDPPPPQSPAPPPGRLSCLLCPLTLPSRRLLDVHVRSHRPAGGFSCVCCRRKADSWEELRPHWSVCRRRRREELGDRGRRKRAAACRRTFRNAASRNAAIHKHSRSSGQPQSSSSSSSSSVAQNAANAGGDWLSDEWREQVIGRAAGKEAEQLNRTPPADSLQDVSEPRRTSRRKEETSEGPAFTCSLCHRKFSSKLTLRRHLGVHGGDKPFTCPHCTYSSRLKASLLQHLRTHTGEKPYRCAECPYASIDRSSLLRHSRTHSQVKPYRCQHCDYSSIQKKSLDLHARRHHTGEAFPCQQCDYSSPDRQLLLRHVRRHHAPPHHAAL